jgi:hypothetical protein
MIQHFRLFPFPTTFDGAGEQFSELALLISSAQETDEQLIDVPHFEKERITEQAKEIDSMLRRMSVREHINRIDAVVEKISEELPTAAPLAVAGWAKASLTLRESGFSNGASDGRRTETFIDSLEDEELADGEDLAQILTWNLSAPVSDLHLLQKNFYIGESTIGQLLSFVESFLAESPGEGEELDMLNRTGETLIDVVKDTVRGLGNESN